MINKKIKSYTNCSECSNGKELRNDLFNCKFNIPPVYNCVLNKINCVKFKKNIK